MSHLDPKGSTESTESTASGWTRRGTPQVNFRAGEMRPALEARAGAGGSFANVASRDLERYYYHIELALSCLTLTAGEAALIVDALNSTFVEPSTAALLWAEIVSALEDGLAEKWKVDGPALVDKVRKLTPFEMLAICDASERFWKRVAVELDEGHEDRLRAVGLLR